jgi:hypothetical protein
MVDAEEVESPTFRLSGECSNQLSYASIRQHDMHISSTDSTTQDFVVRVPQGNNSGYWAGSLSVPYRSKIGSGSQNRTDVSGDMSPARETNTLPASKARYTVTLLGRKINFFWLHGSELWRHDT